jgi:glyoxylase-like metal-dependent hydrolase (beta-lactamase superfamily II)
MAIKIEKVVVGSIETNCYIVSAKNDHTAVIDPGDEAGKIMAEIKKIRDLRLDYILLTHAHFDHVLAVDELKRKFPEAKIFIGQNDQEILANLSKQSYFLSQKVKDLVSPTETVQDGDVLNFAKDKIKVIETPGHTPGGVCYLIDGCLFSGDTLFYHSHGRTDLPTSNNDKMSKSLEKLAKLSENIRVFPGHGPETTIKEEKLLGFLS